MKLTTDVQVTDHVKGKTVERVKDQIIYFTDGTELYLWGTYDRDIEYTTDEND